ncbi:hypothetical protein AGR7A_pAt30099 [Agrobacterium deltaense NCPPB 1641]|uniref:Uncharacterized protein n=1 Tax=Agrobacterium deltaense NCPPB 1641 TaxID=1183425 RepID=A0A1S7UBU2_9HYPH|nr:hypothetical protein AGR7A_pAt30099 [Agrobacterium deltaense NCPPB 1641]
MPQIHHNVIKIGRKVLSWEDISHRPGKWKEAKLLLYLRDMSEQSSYVGGLEFSSIFLR